MSKTLQELLAQHADARKELLNKLKLEGSDEDRLHILSRLKVPWLFSEPRSTIWVAPTIPGPKVSDADLTAWICNATHFSLLLSADAGKPALYEVDGTTVALYAYRQSTDLVVLLLLDPALRGDDAVGLRIHDIACSLEAEAQQQRLAMFGLDDLVMPMPDSGKGTLH